MQFVPEVLSLASSQTTHVAFSAEFTDVGYNLLDVVSAALVDADPIHDYCHHYLSTLKPGQKCRK